MATQHDASASSPIDPGDLLVDDRFILGSPTNGGFEEIEAQDLLTALGNLGAPAWKVGSGATVGRRFLGFLPNPDIDGTASWNVYASSTPSAGHDSNFVVEIGHGATGGGTVSTAYGGYRDAWEQRFWDGSRYFAERHIAAVRNAGATNRSLLHEIRQATFGYDQTDDSTFLGLAGDTIDILDGDPTHTGTQGRFMRMYFPSGTKTIEFWDSLVKMENSRLMVGGGDLGAFFNAYSGGASAAGGMFNFQIAAPANNDLGIVGNIGAGAASVLASGITGNTSANLDHYLQQNGNGRVSLWLNAVGTGDPVVLFNINGATYWSAGIDNSDGDSFKISEGGVPGNNDHLAITKTGYLTVAGAAGRLGLFGSAPVAQGASIADADGTLGDVTAKFNALLARVRPTTGVGLIAA
jgi:hypothetical protein